VVAVLYCETGGERAWGYVNIGVHGPFVIRDEERRVTKPAGPLLSVQETDRTQVSMVDRFVSWDPIKDGMSCRLYYQELVCVYALVRD
jgi:hypothetical protein